jgi:hypothetical protein
MVGNQIYRQPDWLVAADKECHQDCDYSDWLFGAGTSRSDTATLCFLPQSGTVIGDILHTSTQKYVLDADPLVSLTGNSGYQQVPAFTCLRPCASSPRSTIIINLTDLCNKRQIK